MNTFKIIDRILTFYKARNYEEKRSEGLIIPSFPNDFNPSTATTQVIKLVNRKEPINQPYKFALIDRCSRHLDWERCGFDFYVSFFEMISAMNALSSYKVNSMQIKENMFEDFFQLIESLGIERGNLLVTVFGGNKIKQEQFEKDVENKEILEKMGAKVIETPGTNNFYYPKYDRHPAGLRIEVFYNRGEKANPLKRYVEIASFAYDSFLFDKSKKKLVPSKNVIWGTAFGVERISMVLQRKDSIYELELYLPIIRLIEDKIKQDKNDILLLISRREINLVADYLTSAVFIICDSVDKSLSNNQRQMLERLLRRVYSIGRNLNTTQIDFYFQLVDKIISIYDERYPFLQKNMKFVKNKMIDIYEKTRI